MSLLWGLINALQILTHLPFVNTNWPDNATVYFLALYNIANFDVLPTEEIEETITEQVGKDEQDQEQYQKAAEFLNDRAKEAGYENADNFEKNVLNNLLLVSGVIIGLLIFILRMCCWRVQRVRSCLTGLLSAIFFNFFIRLVFETFLETAVIYMIKMHDISNESSYDTLNTVLALACLGCLTLFTFSIPIFLSCKRD